MLMSCMEVLRFALFLHSKEVPGLTPLGQGLFIVCLHVLSMSTWVLSRYSVFLLVGDSKLNLGMIVYMLPLWWADKGWRPYDNENIFILVFLTLNLKGFANSFKETGCIY